MPSIAALAKDPPVPLSAVTARPAVCNTASVMVALPLSTEAVVSVIAVDAPDHRGSNQSASKSRREKVIQQRRKLPIARHTNWYSFGDKGRWEMCQAALDVQYTHGRVSQ